MQKRPLKTAGAYSYFYANGFDMNRAPLFDIDRAPLQVRTYGEEIVKLPLKRMVEAANQCIDSNLVPYMDPVKMEEGFKLAAAVQTALGDDMRARAEADARMPELTGSDSQVRWAMEIRRDAIEIAQRLRQYALRQQDEKMAILIDTFVAKSLRKESRARWFFDLRIEWRQHPLIIKIISQQVDATGDAPVSQAEAEACEEMTLRPKMETHAGRVEIGAWGGRLLVLYGNDRDFLRVVRTHRLRWDPDVMGWRGRNERKAMPVAEQTARLAASLIEEGFAMMVTNDEARDKARALARTGAY